MCLRVVNRMSVERPGSQEPRHAAGAERSGSGGPGWMTTVLLVLYLGGICSRGAGFYGVAVKTAPSLWMSVVRGTADAPEQYRVGVVMAGYWISERLRMPLSVVFAAFDLIASLTAALVLYRILEATEVYRRASTAMQWFGSASFLALTVYYLDWTNWYQKVETLPTAAMVALMLWLVTPRGDGGARGRPWAIAVGLVALAAGMAVVRADVAAAVCGGIFLASATGISPRLAIPRAGAVATSLVGGLVAAGIQLYLMRVAYPHATYGGVHMFMLKYDFKRLTKWASWLIFTAPILWTAAQAGRRRFAGEGAAGALLLAGIGYLGLWVGVGRLDEVRLFIPLAMANLPLTVEMILRRVEEAERGPGLDRGRKAVGEDG
jgi:hypothetical protein